MSNLDAVIIGAGHNGLVCGSYLAAQGLKVCILDQRHIVGGAAVTEEFHPGFRNSVASYAVSLLSPKVIADLDLHRHGLTIVKRRILNFLPLPGGDYFMASPGITSGQIERFSKKDVAAYAEFSSALERVSDVIRREIHRAPPNLTEGSLWGAGREILKALSVTNGFRKLRHEDRNLLYDLFTKSAGDLLDSWFESDPIKAVLGFDAIVGNYASPYTPGSGYVLLHHCFGEVNGERGIWGHAIGGMGAITQAMAKCLVERGGEIRTGARVRELIVTDGTATGVVLDDGTAISARVVVSSVNPKLLFTQLLDPDTLPVPFARRMKGWRNGSGTFRMNVALSALPRFTAHPDGEDYLTAGIIIAPDLGYMERAWHEAKLNGWSSKPIIEMLIPSTQDDTLAPRDGHVASLFCQHVAPELPDGASWDAHRDEVADLMIDTVEEYAPGFRASILARQIKSPLDLEREFGLLGGDIFHGALTLDQIYSARPALGYADYRTPLARLYQCGSGTHPGGGVTGAPGHNAAQAILSDLKIRPGRRAAGT